jgi:hypothetical protein
MDASTLVALRRRELFPRTGDKVRVDGDDAALGRPVEPTDVFTRIACAVARSSNRQRGMSVRSFRGALEPLRHPAPNGG